MCGIVGLISTIASGFDYYADDLFSEMLRMDAIRGPDSTGAFGISKFGAVDVIKGNGHAHDFVQCKIYEK